MKTTASRSSTAKNLPLTDRSQRADLMSDNSPGDSRKTASASQLATELAKKGEPLSATDPSLRSPKQENL
jgi:hypothetical protein